MINRHHVFYNELKVAPEEHAVVLSYPSDCSEGTKSRMVQIMFETYSVLGLHLGDMARIIQCHYVEPSSVH